MTYLSRVTKCKNLYVIKLITLILISISKSNFQLSVKIGSITNRCSGIDPVRGDRRPDSRKWRKSSLVSKVIRDCFGFASLSSVIGLESSRHPLNQSDSKLKPIATWSLAFSRA